MQLQVSESEIAGTATTAEIWEALRRYFQGTAVEKIAYLHLPPLGAPDSNAPELLSEGVSPTLAERYLNERLYRDNPVLSRAHRLVRPVYWDEVDPEAVEPRERAFFMELREAGFERGVGLPVFGPHGRRGQFSLGFGGGVRRLEPEILREYWQICVLAHLRFCALVLPALGAPVRLSRRETEVLGWVARGKSSALIGNILGISTSTVDAHLRRIYLKLGVFDRISAAVRGIGTGLIHADV